MVTLLSCLNTELNICERSHPRRAGFLVGAGVLVGTFEAGALLVVDVDVVVMVVMVVDQYDDPG